MTIISPLGVSPRKSSLAALLAGIVAVAGATPWTPASAAERTDAAPPPSPIYLSITGRPALRGVQEIRRGGAEETDPGVYLSGTVGYVFSSNLRAEIEAFYRRDGLGALIDRARPLDMTFTPSTPAFGDASLYGGMARGFWEFGAGTNFTPYIGGGVGLATATLNITVDGAAARDEENLLTYEFTAGARYAITPRSSLRAGYRMSGIRERNNGPGGADERIHAIEFGINYRF